MYERLCHFLGREDLLEDERFETIDDRLEHRDVLKDEFTTEFESYDQIELEKGLMDAGVPTGAVRTVGDIVDTDPHVADRSMLVDSYNPEADEEVVTPALPFRFSSAIHDGTFSSRPPKKGEHTVDILETLSYTEREIVNLFEQDVVFAEG